MPQTKKHDSEFLHAALIGLQHILGGLEERIAHLRSLLGGQPAPRKTTTAAPESGAKKRTMSASARRRIALAQKRRWATFNAAKAKPAAVKAAGPKAAPKAAPKPPKRELSAEGRARIIAATKKRWAAFHKAQKAPKPAAQKA